MSKNIFKLSFEVSTKIVQSRFEIQDSSFDGNRKINYFNSNNNFISNILTILIFDGFAVLAYLIGRVFFSASNNADAIIGVSIKNINMAVNISNIISPFLKVMLILIGLAGLILLLPSKNLVWFRITFITYMILIEIMTMVSIIPMGVALMLEHWGEYSTIIGLSYLFFFFCIYSVNDYLRKYVKLFNRGKYLNLLSLFKYSIYIFIACLVIAIIYKRSISANLLAGALLFILEILLIVGLIGMLNSMLTYYYMLKYPKQYRIYFRIRDDAWWMSTRRANKHEHVYPVPEKLKKQTEQ